MVFGITISCLKQMNNQPKEGIQGIGQGRVVILLASLVFLLTSPARCGRYCWPGLWSTGPKRGAVSWRRQTNKSLEMQMQMCAPQSSYRLQIFAKH